MNFPVRSPVSQPLAIIFDVMKLRDRYRQLQDPAVVKAMVLRSVYASMALENQTVSIERLEALYAQTASHPTASQAGGTVRKSVVASRAGRTRRPAG